MAFQMHNHTFLWKNHIQAWSAATAMLNVHTYGRTPHLKPKKIYNLFRNSELAWQILTVNFRNLWAIKNRYFWNRNESGTRHVWQNVNPNQERCMLENVWWKRTTICRDWHICSRPWGRTATGEIWNELPKRHSTRQHNTETYSICKEGFIQHQDLPEHYRMGSTRHTVTQWWAAPLPPGILRSYQPLNWAWLVGSKNWMGLNTEMNYYYHLPHITLLRSQ